MKTLRKTIKNFLHAKVPGFKGWFSYYGIKVYFPNNSLLFRLACEQGIYEEDNLRILLALVQPNSVFFDIGANIGLMSIPVLHDNSSCKVISFEPSPNALPSLKRTVENSKFNQRWKVVEKAAGCEVGIVSFFIASPDLGAFDGIKNTQRANTNTEIQVPVTTIDSEWENLGKPAVSVIKIDVEGSELEALQGATNCIRNESPSILMEWNATNLNAYDRSPECLLSFAEEFKYTIFSLPNLVPVSTLEALEVHMLKTESFLLVSKKSYLMPRKDRIV